MEKEVRVRFAPSPTGVLHIGGVRTALYNYLFAKKNNGKMILRIEDTDQSRYVPEAENYINESLAWCGIVPDESPLAGGPYGPYIQSERKELYKEHVNRLLEEGKAYYAFDTAEELDAMREKLKEAKANSLNYNSISRNSMKNSLTLSKEEVEQKLEAGEPYVIRIKVPPKEEIRLNDMIRGWVMVHSSTMDDKVLMKSDGMPTYHLANVVDDYLMKISHVIRGEEWLPSAPLHVLLYQYLGWEDSMPKFAHLPLLLKPDGNGKLSKRDAQKHGFPIFPLEWKVKDEDSELKGFREEGYLRDAFVNFLAFLGWNPGTEEEIFSLEQLIEEFSIERINKSGAKFDIQKAIWFNQQYIRKQPIELLASNVSRLAKEAGFDCSPEKALAIADLLRERIDLIPELLEKGIYFFTTPKSYDEKVIRKRWKGEAKNVLTYFAESLNATDQETSDGFQEKLNAAAEKNNVGAGSVMQLLRVAVSGEQGGPDLMKIMEILGTQETVSRIYSAMTEFDKIINDAR
ncbi:glutamate--tRNA ligase [Reichenbachiella sp. MALMAid0571]|uniref:glutamate--tRNA ligase n=1 Tax=Reichenbachiella sp. MALMAid0571 TaxID=3143939 RepID=UPI0032DFDBDA